MKDLHQIQLGTKVNIQILSDSITEIRDRLIDERARLQIAFPDIHPTLDARTAWTGEQLGWACCLCPTFVFLG